MAGGLLNIISVGNNNIILTGNPTKPFFKVVYSKYTNFGLQKFRIDYSGQRDLRPSDPSTFTFKIPRYAELLMDTYLVVNIPDIWSPIYHPCKSTGYKWSPYEFRWIRDLGTHMIKEISITCGSQLIQKYSGEYLAAMVERDFPEEKKKLFHEMTGNIDYFHDPANYDSRINTYPCAYYTTNQIGTEPSIRGRTIYIPINSWFTLNSKCAFPLVSLQYNELNINVTMRPIKELFQIRDVFDPVNNYPYIAPDFNEPQFQMYRFLQTPPSVILDAINYSNNTLTWNADIHLMCTYCFLSNEESQLFAAEDQVYLIKDIYEYQFNNVSGTQKLKLQSSGMVSNWMWFFRRNDVKLRNEWSNYTNWPYRHLPADIVTTNSEEYRVTLVDIISNPLDDTYHPNGIPYGPNQDPDGNTTAIFVTGDYVVDNNKNIMLTMGILLNGDYRENTLTHGIFQYLEKYLRTKGNATDGLYFYNFCLNTDPFEYQPSGAINMSKFKTIELELSTYVPPIDLENSVFAVQCDPNGNVISVTKQNWRLTEYNFDMVLFEERYNILSFIGGNCGLLYAK
jgi:hypothetical protein